MKLIKHLLLVLVFGFAMGQFLPWWNVALAGALAAIILDSSFRDGFLGGFLGIFLLWSGMALLISWETGSPLPDRVAALLPFGFAGFGLSLFSGLVGGLVAGLAGLAGVSLRRNLFS